MGETKARVDALIVKLGDLSDEVRLEAIEELGTIDKEHALPALHWAIQNELDERVRNAARDTYQRLSRGNQPDSKAQAAASEDKTRRADRLQVKAVVFEEGAVNPAGQLSFKIGMAAALLVIAWLFIDLGQIGARSGFMLWWLRIATAASVPGIVLGIIGVTRRGERHIPAILGTVVNTLLLILFVFGVVLPMIRG